MWVSEYFFFYPLSLFWLLPRPRGRAGIKEALSTGICIVISRHFCISGCRATCYHDRPLHSPVGEDLTNVLQLQKIESKGGNGLCDSQSTEQISTSMQQMVHHCLSRPPPRVSTPDNLTLTTSPIEGSPPLIRVGVNYWSNIRTNCYTSTGYSSGSLIDNI